MSDPDTNRVNPAITDAVTQTNVKVLGDAPAMAMSNLYQVASTSLPGFPTGHATPGRSGLQIYATDMSAAALATLHLINGSSA